MKVELIATPLLSKEGMRGAALVVFNDKRKEVKLRITGAEPDQLTVRPQYSYYLIKMRGDGHVSVSADDDESFDFDVKFSPARRFEVYLVPTVHTDWGYTATQDVVAQIHKRNTEVGLKLAQNGVKWVAEVINQMVDHKEDQAIREQNRLGYFGIQALPLNVLVGLCSHEELARLLYEAEHLRGKGLRTAVASLNDIPTAPWGLVSALTGAGIRYYIQASNPDRGPLHVNGKIRSPFYWVGPSGKKVLAWFSGGYDGLLFGFNGYHQGMSAGLLSDPSTAAAGIGMFVSQYEARGYPYEEILMYGVYVDNSPVDGKYAETLKEYEKEWANPIVRISTPEEFFELVERKYGERLPEIKGDFGSYWEDGAASSALEEAESLQAKRLITAYEAIHALDPYGLPIAARAWEDLIYWDEHTWGDAKSVSDPHCEAQEKQWAIKAAFSTRPLNDLREALGQGYYFNPYPYQISFYEDGAFYELEPLSSTEKVPTELKPIPFPGVLENEFYRLEFKDGKIKRVYDKQMREFVFSDENYYFDECIYVKGGKGTRLERTITNWWDFGNVREPLEGKDYAIQREKCRVLGYEEGAGVKRARVEAVCGPLRVIKTIELGSKKKEIRVKNEVMKPEEYDKEALYFAFPFNFERPEVYVEEPGAFTDVNAELAPGACAGWFSTAGITALSGELKSSGLLKRHGWAFLKSWDAPLVTIGDINRGKWPSQVPRSGLVFSYVMNNYWHTNYKAAQGGAVFSYSVTTFQPSETGLAKAAKFLSSGVPVGVRAKGPELKVDGDVLCTAVKRWEKGDGLIVRLLEVEGTPKRVTLTAKGDWEFIETDLVESPIKKLGEGERVEFEVPPRDFKTIALRGRSPAGSL